MNQICLPIEYPYRILSIFPTGSRRNQAGTKHRQHTRYRLRGHDSKIGFARCCQLTELLMFAQPVSHFQKSERAKMGAPVFQRCSRMFLIRDARMGSHQSVLLATQLQSFPRTSKKNRTTPRQCATQGPDPPSLNKGPPQRRPSAPRLRFELDLYPESWQVSPPLAQTTKCYPRSGCFPSFVRAYDCKNGVCWLI